MEQAVKRSLFPQWVQQKGEWRESQEVTACKGTVQRISCQDGKERREQVEGPVLPATGHSGGSVVRCALSCTIDEAESGQTPELVSSSSLAGSFSKAKPEENLSARSARRWTPCGEECDGGGTETELKFPSCWQVSCQNVPGK